MIAENRRSLRARVSGRALSAITAANLGRDSLHGPLQFARHFDNSLIAEGLAYIVVPLLKPLAKRLAPCDGHAWMSLDTPDGGPLFACWLETATRRAGAGFDRTLAASGQAGGRAGLSRPVAPSQSTRVRCYYDRRPPHSDRCGIHIGRGLTSGT